MKVKNMWDSSSIYGTLWVYTYARTILVCIGLGRMTGPCQQAYIARTTLKAYTHSGKDEQKKTFGI